jgi:ABC-type phosphate transport system substrate-binding protein
MGCCRMAAVLLFWPWSACFASGLGMGDGQQPLVAVPYFVQSIEPIKAIVEGCIKSRPELALTLRAGVSLTASLGRFCDKDEPFEAIVHNAKSSEREIALLSNVFPTGSIQPQCIFLGQRRLIAIVHPDNPVKTLDVSQIQEILKKGGSASTWNKVGGGSARPISVYDQGPKSWSRHMLKMRCMSFEKPMGGGIMKGWYDFREDIKQVLDLETAVAQVKREPAAICFVEYQGQPLKGVSLISIKAAADSTAVSPELKPTIQEDFPLAEPLFLWVHPKASDTTRSFAEFASSENAAKILERHGFVTPWMQAKYEAELRLADAKAGRGIRLSAIGCEQMRSAMPDLAAEYVKAKVIVQLSYSATESDVTAIGAFVRLGADATMPAEADVSPVAAGSPSPEPSATAPASMPASAPAITPFVRAGGKEILFLDGKPGDMAMKLHGEKWNALGPDGTGPVEYTLAGRAAAIIVNPANKLEALSLAQVQAIFGGEVDDWAIIGGTGLSGTTGVSPVGNAGNANATSGTPIAPIKINAFGLRASDPATDVFGRECLPRDKWKRVTAKKDTTEAIAAVSMDPQAIAFVDLTAIPVSGQTVKVLGIRLPAGKDADGKPTTKVYMPTAENIKNAMYPLSSRIFLYIHPKASDTAKDFAKFLATCGGSEASPYADTVKTVMETYQRHGLIPLADAAIQRATKDAEAAAKAKEAASQAAKAKGKGK